MITAGIDIGHKSVKVVLLEGDQILGQAGFIIAGEVEAAARIALDTLLDQKGIGAKQVDGLLATGVGREKITLADSHRTEMLCHVVGAHWFFPQVRTVIDLGAEGNLTDFLLNDKCAAGAGIFLETVAFMLKLPIDQIGPASLRSSKKVELTTTCAVFAESEIVAEIHRGAASEDILSCVHESIVAKVIANINRVGVEPEVALTGGLAKNVGMVETFRRQLGMDPKVSAFPEITGAIGAAILAANSLENH
jgi:(R)-2-hydroxyacyl-CoA dehydratese activating ATPase